jgi:AcrR family transcriptional regulator
MSKVTRNKIVQKCFEAIAEHGFCTLRTDKEIQRLKITKGAFYHYFPGKMELGYAVIDEVLLPMYTDKWSSLENLTHGIAGALYTIIEREKVNATEQSIARGDVLCNLMVEMSHEDELFRDKLEVVLETQVRTLQKAILAGKAVGEIKPQTDARSMAYSIIGQLQGCYAIAKTRKSRDVFTLMVNTLQRQMKELLIADTLPTGMPQRSGVAELV